MSLFIGTLAFSDAALLDQVRLGVLGGSLLSALLGVAILMAASYFEQRGTTGPVNQTLTRELRELLCSAGVFLAEHFF